MLGNHQHLRKPSKNSQQKNVLAKLSMSMLVMSVLLEKRTRSPTFRH